jgi:hypothetical protein
MQIRIRWTTLGLWLMASCIAALSCSLIRPAAHIGDDYFPIGNDSFYHATRILEAARDPAAFHEFDPKIHAPEGSLLVWPWGYDFVIAKIVRLGGALGVSADPLTILSWIPVSAVFLGIGLLMLVAHRVSLQTWPMALAGLCMALHATTQNLYGYAQIDHHYAEHLLILATLAGGLAWFNAPSRSSGLALGALFGLALAVHNALFILPIPFLATALVQWLHGKKLPLEPVVAFAVSLLASALAVMIPSQPFQELRFEFYTLSWFHLYIVCSTALVALLLAILPPNRRSILAMTAIAAALLLPLMGQIRYAQSFVSGSLGMLADIMEMRSPIKLALDGETQFISGFYSLLGWLAPVTFGLCVYRAWRERREPRLLFWISCVLGLTLMSTQLRMHYFGGFAMYLPWLIVAQEYAVARPDLYKRAWLTVSLLLVLAYAPVIRHALIAPVPKAGDEWFDNVYPLLRTLEKACAEDPGIVLADSNAGHYIRYFTDCSVIANNFLLTEQQFAKVDEVRRLFSLPANEFSARALRVKYVLVRAADIQPSRDDHFSFTFFGDASRLPQTLLLAPQEEVPSEFKLLFRATIYDQSGTVRNIPYAKLYKMQPRESASQGVSRTETSANEGGE